MTGFTALALLCAPLLQQVAAPAVADDEQVAVLEDQGAADTESPAAGKSTSSRHVRTSDEEVTLTIWNREIVVFRASFKDATPEWRADHARSRLARIEPTGEWNVEVIAAQVGDLEGYYISVDGQNVFGLMEEDLDPVTSRPLEVIANQAAENLREMLEARWSARRPEVLLRGAGFAALATLVFAILMRLLGRVITFLTDRLPRLLPKVLLTWRPGGFDLSESLAELRLFAIRLLSLIAGLALTYLWLTFTLAQFPYTTPLSDGLGDNLFDSLRSAGDGAMEAIPGLFVVFVVVAITRMLVRLITAFFSAIERGATRVSWLEAETARATRRIVTVMVWLGALMFAYPYIPGSGTAAFKGVGLFMGLLVTIGSSGLVSQVMSGLVVLYSRTLKVGDYVQIGTDEGVVSSVGFLSTRIATPKQEEIIIPNSVLTVAITRNLSRIEQHHGVVAWTSVTIGYDTPWKQVEDLLLAAAERTDHLRATPAPHVLQQALSDFYVHYELIFHVETPELRGRTLSRLHQQIQDGFNAAGVQIMSPHFVSQPETAVLAGPANAAEQGPGAAPD